MASFLIQFSSSFSLHSRCGPISTNLLSKRERAEKTFLIFSFSLSGRQRDEKWISWKASEKLFQFYMSRASAAALALCKLNYLAENLVKRMCM